METFSALLAICVGNSPAPGEFPAQRPVTRSFDVFFDLRPNKRLSKQWWGWWFDTPSRPLWRQCNEPSGHHVIKWKAPLLMTTAWLLQMQNKKKHSQSIFNDVNDQPFWPLLQYIVSGTIGLWLHIVINVRGHSCHNVFYLSSNDIETHIN